MNKKKRHQLETITAINLELKRFYNFPQKDFRTAISNNTFTLVDLQSKKKYN